MKRAPRGGCAVVLALGDVTVVDAGFRSVTEYVGFDRGCFTNGSVSWVEVAIAFAPEAAPWRDALYYETVVDGAVYHDIGPESLLPITWVPGRNHHGSGHARLEVVCRSGAPGGGFTLLDEGVHQVSFRARLVGTDEWLETPAVPVAIWCTGPRGALIGGVACDAGGALAPRGGPRTRGVSPVVLGALALGVAALVRLARRRPR